MARKVVIQVPVDEGLLEALDAAATEERVSRSEVIRSACQRYLRQRERGRLDELYQRGYERLPEESSLGEAQAQLVGRVVSEERW